MIENIQIPTSDAGTAEYISLDNLITPRDIGGLEKGKVDSGPSSPGVEMNTEDLKLLGFHVVEADEMPPEQRPSKIEVTYE